MYDCRSAAVAAAQVGLRLASAVLGWAGMGCYGLDVVLGMGWELAPGVGWAFGLAGIGDWVDLGWVGMGWATLGWVWVGSPGVGLGCVWDGVGIGWGLCRGLGGLGPGAERAPRQARPAPE